MVTWLAFQPKYYMLEVCRMCIYICISRGELYIFNNEYPTSEVNVQSKKEVIEDINPIASLLMVPSLAQAARSRVGKEADPSCQYLSPRNPP